MHYGAVLCLACPLWKCSPLHRRRLLLWLVQQYSKSLDAADEAQNASRYWKHSAILVREPDKPQLRDKHRPSDTSTPTDDFQLLRGCWVSQWNWTLHPSGTLACLFFFFATLSLRWRKGEGSKRFLTLPQIVALSDVNS